MQLKGLANQVLLVILDGFGYSDNKNKNAARDAKTPHIDNLHNNYPFTTIKPGGIEVGLPKGVAGNSEVGHMNLGAGRPVRQDLVRINEAIEKNSLKEMPKYLELIESAKKTSKRIHLMGLLSDGGVHSHIDHIKHIINSLNEHTDLEILFHAFMDGRDTQKDHGLKYTKELISFGGTFKFASMQGRSIGMDRDQRWEKIEHCYRTLVGQGHTTNYAPVDYIQKEYEIDKYDEFITPVLFNDAYRIEKDDSVFFINFRPDRAKQITTALTDLNFKHFPISTRPNYFLCMTPYVNEELPEVPILFDKEKVLGTLGEYLSKQGKKQFRIAETEKFAHITYFFNGGETKAFPLEERVLINSPKDVATYDLKPEMSAPKVLDQLLTKLDDDSITFYLVNFANADMVGHTGNYEAAIKAIEAVDECVGQLIQKCSDNEIAMILTADHGNCDQMIYENGMPHTSHTNADVPFSIFSKRLKSINLVKTGENFALKDVASTVLHILDIKKPKEFTGNPIFK